MIPEDHEPGTERTPAGRDTMPVVDQAYYDDTRDRPLHPLYGILEPHLGSGGGVAVELGCGVGHGARFLARKGFRVFAVDREPRAIDELRSRKEPGEWIDLVLADMRVWPIPACDVLVAGFCLFFLPPHEFAAFWDRMNRALKPGGLMQLQLLGVNDQWSDPSITRHTRDEVESLLSDFDVLHLEEVEREGTVASGSPKYWHVFHIVARRRRPSVGQLRDDLGDQGQRDARHPDQTGSAAEPGQQDGRVRPPSLDPVSFGHVSPPEPGSQKLREGVGREETQASGKAVKE
ncbi:MAG: class I SAM-dependent methyltransferase [Fimbriimonadaceae bacterium]